MKKLFFAVFLIILLAAFSFPILNGHIAGNEKELIARQQSAQRQKEISALYRDVCGKLLEGDYSEALILSDKCLDMLSPEDDTKLYAQVLMNKALSLYGAGEYSASQDICNILTEQSRPEAYLLKAQNSFKLGDTDSEEDSLIRYAEITGDKSRLNRAGKLAMNRGDYTEAIAYFNEYDASCLSGASAADEAVFRRAVCYMSTGDYVRAADDLKRCEVNGIETDEAQFYLAVCLMKLGNTQEAESAFEKCIAEGCHTEEARELIGLCS